MDAGNVGQDQADFEGLIEEQERLLQFSPEKGNVAFASAYDCWSFTLPSFAPKIAQKLGMNPRALCKFLWGEFFYSPADKKNPIKTKPINDKSQPMFVSLIMNPLVERYKKNFDEKTAASTALVREAHAKIKEALQQFIPMEEGILRMVVEHLPSPVDAQKTRIAKFCPALVKT